jgi:exonuclease V gamma subunit
MPATLHFSNSLDALADRLIANVREAGGDPFDTTAIATPASAMRDWLKVRIAEKTGIAANIAFPHLENLLWDLLAKRDRYRDTTDRLPARLLDTFSFQGLVLSRLRHDPPAALREYLTSAQPEDAARRQCQLAGQLASLFREYEYNRVAERGYPGLAESWMRGEPSFEKHLVRGQSAHPARAHLGDVSAMEAWQMDIYKSLFETGGLRDQWGEAVKTYRYTLPQYAHMALSNAIAPEDATRTYHLFGLSNISPFHRDLIGQLADVDKLGAGAARFEIYALNPCAEYWEDVLTLRERRSRGMRTLKAAPVDPVRVAATRPSDAERDAGEMPDAADENGLLALFGKPGRETIKLWCQLTEHDFNEDFRGPQGSSLLDTVRNAILHRSGPLQTRCTPDLSFRLRKASDPRAELEAVRAEIAEALRADPSLKPEDIALIPADPATVLPLLRAVFAGSDRTPGNVPLLFPEGGAQDEGPLVKGFRGLLALASGDFNQEALLTLLDNPLVRRAAGLEDAPSETIASLFEAAGFNRGWNSAVDGNSSADAALERAIISMALDADDSALSGRTLPQAIPGFWGRLDREVTGALLEWIFTLRHRLLVLRDGQSRSFAEWATILRALRETFLKTGESEDRESLDLRRFFDEMETWGTWDAAGGETANATLVTMLFADRFRGQEGVGRAAFLRGGVRTGALNALRGLPFRRVWVVGLTTDFPSTGDAMPLDLRAFRRLSGESDPSARDLYALLEVIASCTESLSLSYSQRGLDGRARQPSRALTGLVAWLETDILPEHNTVNFDPMKPPRLPAPPRYESMLPVYAAETTSKPVQKINDLGLFLRNPVLHATMRIFRSDDREALDEKDTELSTDLFIDKWEGHNLLDACLRSQLRREGGAADQFEQLWLNLLQGGHVPPAPWSGLAHTQLREALTERVMTEAESLQTLMRASGLRFTGSLRLGPQGAERAEPPVTNLPAFHVPTEAGELKLGGLLPWTFRGVNGWALLANLDRDFAPYLIPLCLAALQPLPPALAAAFPGRGRLWVRSGDDGSITEYLLPEYDVAQAREILHDLCDDFAAALHGEGHLNDVPLDLIEKVWTEHEKVAELVVDWDESIATRRRQAEETGRERLTLPERKRRAIAPLLPPDLNHIIERRVLPYLKWKNTLTQNNTAAGAYEQDDGGAA